HPRTTAPSTLSLHDALPISLGEAEFTNAVQLRVFRKEWTRLEARSVHDLFLQHQAAGVFRIAPLGSEIWEKALVLSRQHSARFRSEEHTSELQSRSDLVCRL